MSGMNLKIGTGNLHTKELVDDGTGIGIEFTHRLPTNRERAAYQAKATKVKGRKKLVVRASLAARECVLPLIQGFRFTTPAPEQTLNRELEDGKLVPLSSDPNEPGFHPDWLAGLADNLPHLVEGLGTTIFAGVTDDEGNIVFDYGEVGPDVEPLDEAQTDEEAEEAGTEENPNG